MKENRLESVVNELIGKINNILGQKIVTLIYSDFGAEQKAVYDISKNGEIGYSEDDKSTFIDQLAKAIQNGGALTLRQFTEIYDGNLPIKRLYGIRLGKGTYEGVSKEELKIAFNTDANTGAKLSVPKDIVYCKFE